MSFFLLHSPWTFDLIIVHLISSTAFFLVGDCLQELI